MCEKLRSARFLRRAVQLDRHRSNGGSEIYSGEVTATIRIPSCSSLLPRKLHDSVIADESSQSLDRRQDFPTKGAYQRSKREILVAMVKSREEKADVTDKSDHSKEARNFVDASQEQNLTIQERDHPGRKTGLRRQWN